MLHITRREWESFSVDGPADVMVRKISRGRVEISIAAPDGTTIVRNDAKDRTPRPRGRQIDNPPAAG